MFEFNGPITGNCKRFLINRQIKNQTVASTSVCLLFIPIVVSLSVFIDTIILILLIPLLMLVIFSLIKPGEKTQKNIVPICVCIDCEEGVIIRSTANGKTERSLSSIKCIEDYGDWYYFVFNYESRDPYFVCQKDLLSIGEIEEFEKLFDDKIIKKFN